MQKVYRIKTEPDKHRVKEGLALSWALTPTHSPPPSTSPEARSKTEQKIKLPKFKRVDLS